MQKVFISILILLVLNSCKKESPSKEAVALTIINAVPDSKPLATNFNGTGPVRFIDTKKIPYGVFAILDNMYDRAPGIQPLGLYQYPDTLEKDSPLFDLKLELPQGSIHTLFLTGTVSDPDTMLVKENIPSYAGTDSSMGLRLVNLIKGNVPVNVNLAGMNTGSEAENLAYKGITGFKKYPVRSSIDSYVFEFRAVGTGDLIASYPVTGVAGIDGTNVWIYRNFTLALIGKVGGTGTQAPKALIISHTPW